MSKRRCSKVHSTHLLGLFLLLFAWSGVLISSLSPDWRQSIAEVRRKPHNTRAAIPYNETSEKDKWKTDKDNELKRKRWRIVGFKGLWNECAYLPSTVLASMSLLSSRKRRYEKKNDHFVNKTFSARLSKLSRKSSRKISRKKQCTTITLEKSSCLLLGIRTMMLLSILCGTLSVFVAIVSVFSDSKIRALSRFHPFVHRFQQRNAMAVLAGVTASLSGSLALTGCWWFTLKSSTNFFVTSYQHQHEESEAIFVCGSSLMIAAGSGFTYILGGILLGVHVNKICSLSWLSSIFLDQECNNSKFTNLASKNIVYHTQC